MERRTLGEWLRLEGDGPPCVYAIRSGDALLYIGATTRGLHWRLRRHYSDGSSQPSSKVSGLLRRSMPFSKAWMIEAWAPEELAARLGLHGEATLRRVENAARRAWRPLLCAEGAGVPVQQGSLLALLSSVARPGL